jgi:hypothetical protein
MRQARAYLLDLMYDAALHLAVSCSLFHRRFAKYSRSVSKGVHNNIMFCYAHTRYRRQGFLD